MAGAETKRDGRAAGLEPQLEAQPDVETGDLYTRAEALRDGCLIDATPLAAEMGITLPIALTHHTWRRTVVLTLAAHAAGEDEALRLRNILATYRLAALQNPPADILVFTAQVVTASATPIPMLLRALKGQGDRGEPVVTISLFDED
ncbi:MAG: DUF6573 family protein [Polyangiaceae bacterium]